MDSDDFDLGREDGLKGVMPEGRKSLRYTRGWNEGMAERHGVKLCPKCREATEHGLAHVCSLGNE